ncbi:DivIVA domain-containing protein [Micromonospora tarensis]|uniref:DivIVA domain-containing protein n=1 Tax=Micromonospora tarensis TaxID=2806100 RepID=A0ABS1YRQ7_9ACTN|nr:DivIVA domain-containing protein [Micromonospora tarensis]MBM0280113.1 DivIVA domain-containing protein [Micromonospora tarensis]
MSIGAEPHAARDDAASRPSFELALRGYDKRQVDRHLEQLDGQIAMLSGEHGRSAVRVRELTAEVQRLRTELAELKEQPVQVDRASFHDLGPMVGEIMALAEKQAGIITESATDRANELRSEAERILADTRERAAQARQDLAEELAARRAEQEQAHEERRTLAEAELTAIREHAEQLRADGEAAHERAQHEAKRITEQSAQQLNQTRVAADALMKSPVRRSSRSSSRPGQEPAGDDPVAGHCGARGQRTAHRRRAGHRRAAGRR